MKLAIGNFELHFGEGERIRGPDGLVPRSHEDGGMVQRPCEGLRSSAVGLLWAETQRTWTKAWF